MDSKFFWKQRCSKIKKKLFDSAQCQPAQSPTLRSVNQPWICGQLNFQLHTVLACAESLISQISSRKRILSKPVQPFYQGAQMASIHEIKNYKKSRDTTPLKQRVGWLRTTKFCKNHKLFCKNCSFSCESYYLYCFSER